MSTFTVLGAICGAAIGASAFGAINPFTETFSSSSANWAVAAGGPGAAPLTYVGSGGPDGSGYGSGSFGFASTLAGQFPILFRARDSFGSSGGAFSGNWFGAGVAEFSFSVRHDNPAPVTFFARFLANGAFTGVVYQTPTAVSTNTWATFSFALDMSTTPFIFETAPPMTAALYNSTFSNVDQVQIGVIGDAAIVGQTGPFTFDIDNVGIVPAPGAAALLGLAGLVGGRRRRR